MMFVLKPVITLADAGVLMMLGIVFTAVAHSLFISGLRTVKVRIAGILSGLEPVYGTLSAFLFLKEVPSFQRVPWWCYHSGCCVFIDTETGGESI